MEELSKDLITSLRENFMNIEETCGSVKEITTYYKNFIKEFFSKQGEAESIMKIYRYLKENRYNNKECCVNCVNFDNSIAKYTEYLDGMIEFIDDVRTTCSVDPESNKCTNFKEKLNKAIENDNLFIQSLFDNKEKCEKMKISEAVYYIEYLIYFIDKMDEISDKCKKIEYEIDDKNDTSLYNNSYFMMKKSINHFFYSVIITVITTYNVMIDVIDGKSCGECDKEKPMYQLF
jgi:hypothetical protein